MSVGVFVGVGVGLGVCVYTRVCRFSMAYCEHEMRQDAGLSLQMCTNSCCSTPSRHATIRERVILRMSASADCDVAGRVYMCGCMCTFMSA